MVGGRVASTLGRLALVVLVFILFYDVIFGIIGTYVKTGEEVVSGVYASLDKMAINLGGAPPVFPSLESLLTSLFSWFGFVLVNGLGLAVVVAVDVIKEAFASSGQ